MYKKPVLNDILFIFPVMGYFAIEAIIVGVFITILWKLFLSMHLGHLGYLPIVVIYWIIKMLLFDVFKIIAGFSNSGTQIQQETEEEKDYQ